MENEVSFDSNFQSQRCIYCRQKDEMIRKYQKLVQILKRKIRRCSTNVLSNVKSICRTEQCQQMGQKVKQNTCDRINQLDQRIERKGNQKHSSVLTDVTQKYKIVQFREFQVRNKGRPLEGQLWSTAPASFHRHKEQVTKHQRQKKINLSTQWLYKFNEIKKKLQKREERISTLTDRIIQLKNQVLYIRSILFNFLKSLGMNRANEKIKMDNNGKDIVNLIFQIFEYSQEQIWQIYEEDENRRSRYFQRKVIRIEEDRQVYMPNIKDLQMRDLR